MSACPQCGTPSKPTDKFCNSCGTLLMRAAPAPMQQGYGQPPAAQQPQQQPPARCQLGHDIAPGASYCPQGHPISLEAMHFGGDPFAPPAPYGQPPAPPPFGAPQPFGAPPQASPFGAPPQPVPFAASQPPYSPPNYGQPPPQAFMPEQQGYAPPPQPPGFGSQPPLQGQGGPPNAYGGGYAPQPSAAPYNPPQPMQQGYAPPPPAPGVFNPPAVAPAPFGSQPPVEPPRDVPPRIIRGFLVTYQPNPAGDSWTLTGGRHTIGRVGAAEGIDIALADPTISSRHGAIVVDAASGSITVEDTGSTNGTFVNDDHIGFNGRRELRDGDRIRFGGLLTIVKVIGRV